MNPLALGTTIRGEHAAVQAAVPLRSKRWTGWGDGGRRPPTTGLFVATDIKLGNEAELFVRSSYPSR